MLENVCQNPAIIKLFKNIFSTTNTKAGKLEKKGVETKMFSVDEEYQNLE